MKNLRVRSFRHGKNASNGFTLLEVMLAFVVFALSFATVLEILSGSMRSVTRSNDDTEVALFAQSVMDLVGTDIPLEQGQFNGTGLDRYQWQLDIYLFESGEGDDHTMELAELTGVELFRIELNVDWTSGRRQRHLEFATIRGILANR